jgi:hypothetical protein
MGVEKLALNKEYKNDVNSSFVLLKQKFYLSNISIEEANNKKLTFFNKGKYNLKNGLQEEYVKDYVLVNDLIDSLDINTFKSNQSITKLNLTLGLNDKFNALDIKKATDYVELDDISGMYDTTSVSYLSYSAKLVVGQNLKDTITINIKSDINQIINVSGVQSQFGRSVGINLNLLYDKLFSGINFLQGKAIIEQKMISNFGSFVR